MRKVVPDERARQGPAGRPVLGVLVGALLLCAVALAGYMIWAQSDAPPPEATGGVTVGVPERNPTDRVNPANPAYPVPAEPSGTGTTTR